MAQLTQNSKSPADITIADDWCIKLPDGYRYSTFEDEDDGTLLTINANDDSESWTVKRSPAKVEGVDDLLFYGIRTRMELLVFGPNLTGDKTKEFILRHESNLCIFCQLHDSFGRGKQLQSAVYWIQLVTLKAIYEFEIRFEKAGTQDEYQEKLNRIANSFCLKQDKKAPDYTRKFMTLNKKLPVTEPQDESIVKMYRQMLDNQQGYANMMRLGMVMNDSVEYSLQALKNFETSPYSLSESAWKTAEVFRVNENSFNPEADREIEIQHCYIREIDHMQTFRTFAWLVGEYCTQKGCSVEKLDKNAVLALGQLAGSRRSSYDETHYPAICSFPDVFTAYIPDGENCSDLDKLPSKIRDNSSDEWHIADLNELRLELEELYPSMKIIIDYLRSSRKNKDIPLRGDHSDILYVWCSLTIAANRAFAVTPDAPMNYCYYDRMSFQEFIESESMPVFDDDDDDYDYDYNSDEEDDEEYDWEEERKQRIAEKRKRYEDDCVIVKSIPTFSGKTFVASGIDNEEEIKSFLTDKGAFLRKSISGKTDYLIVSPEWAGDSKYKAVLEQAAKGHSVEVIFYDDFVKYLGVETDSEEIEDNYDDTDTEVTGDTELDAAIEDLADKMAKAVVGSISIQKSSDIMQEGNRIVFDDKFSIVLPDGIEFSPETDDSYAMLNGFCRNDDGDSLELTISPLDAKKTGALKASLDENVEGHEDECDYIMLFEDKNTEVAIFIQADVSMMQMECNIIPMIRVGEHSYRFQAQYGRNGFCLADALKQDIKEFCQIFDNIKIKNSKKRIKPEIDRDKLNKIVDMLFGIDKEAASALGEHCTEDTPAIVRDDWVITVPAGYMYSTDEEIVGHRPIVLGLDDGTLDLSAPFDSTINFSVTTPLDMMDDNSMPHLPLNHPDMQGYVQQAQMMGDTCIRKDMDMVIYYSVGTVDPNGDDGTLCISRGCIVTRNNVYAFQMFDCQASTESEAEYTLRQLLLSIRTKEEYEEEQYESAENSAKMAELNDQLQSLTSQMEAGLSDMQAWAEREKQRLEEEERKKEELEKKKQAAKANRNADEESVFMYITLIIDKANGNDMSDEKFYNCYEDDFPALDQKGLSQLRQKIKAEMQRDPKCYEIAVCELPYDKRCYYSAKNMYNTHNYSGDPNEDVESLIMDTVSRWFESSELSQVRSEVRQLIEDERTNLDEGLASVNEDWKNFYLATDSLYIGLLDASDETYDPKNMLMVQYGNIIGAVQLATSGIFRMSTKLMNYFPVYWDVTLEEIWNAAKENGVYDQRESKDDGQEERIAQAIYDKAMQKLGIKTATPSYSSRTTEPTYQRSGYEPASPTPTPVSSYSDDTNNTPKKKEGCYIATAVYGSYDAPEVITLRRFRDETLKKSFFGRLFIKVYYTLSPPIAKRLKNARRVNSCVKKLLDKLVNKLQSK